jgi:hypothetical protein
MDRKGFLNRLLLSGAAIGLAKISKASDTIQPIISEAKDSSNPFINSDEAMHPKYKNYKANKFGDIISIPRKGTRSTKENILKIAKGYVRISHKSHTKTLKANRIVYECFYGKEITSQSYIVIHRDGNINNLCISNLELVSKKNYSKYKPTKKAIRESNGRVIKWI